MTDRPRRPDAPARPTIFVRYWTIPRKHGNSCTLFGMEIECYGQRLLNPFRGVMQVVRFGPAEAVSMDGVRWEIYVANDTLLEGLQGDAHAQVSDIRYGSWSREAGLRRGPLYPSEDFRRMEMMGAVVYHFLHQDRARPPFPLRDRFELWLHDAAGRPLALLDSAVDESSLTAKSSPRWQAGMAAHDAFISDSQAAGDEPRNPADRLSAYIDKLAGPDRRARWYRRDDRGDGHALDWLNDATGPGPDLVAATDFPVLLVRQDGHDALHTTLLRDYLDWQAAWLLCLPDLSETDRRQLEQAARMRPALVESAHRLYPAIHDLATINAARVHARLLASQAFTDQQDESTPSTFYIELNPVGGGYT